ncbi:MAG: MFS transporter [Bacteroidetes bacterium]|nr:MAG: MFS transporter [Bacteroidota bacterium]
MPPATPSHSGRHPWWWIPSLYFTEGLPYVLVMTVSVVMYKRLGIDNTQIAFYTSLLYLPWVIKPIWSPVVDLVRTKRWWTVAMQLTIALGLLGVALSLPLGGFFAISLGFFWLMAISSATHDIAADGFYMLALRDDQQAFFVGIRSTFYRLAMMSGEGAILILAGWLEVRTGDNATAWSVVFLAVAAVMALMAIYHGFILPRPDSDQPTGTRAGLIKSFLDTFGSFFRKPQIGIILAFILLYRLGESQLIKLAGPFLLDPAEKGGLGLDTATVGWINGFVGVPGLVLGGILGGVLASRHGLKYWIWWMVAAINLPNLAYVFLAWLQPEQIWIVASAIGIEKFGYGFGFTAFMLYLIYVARGPQQTSHYAIATGFMALGMMLPGMVSGWIQAQIGYLPFFIWVMIATLPGFVITAFIPLDAAFGKKKA